MNPPRRAERPQPRAAEPPPHRIAMNRIAANPIGANLSGGQAAHSRPSGSAPAADWSVELMADGSSQREATTDCGALASGAVALLSSLTAGLAGIAGARPPLRLGGSMLVCAGSSACASATERCIGAAAIGATGFARSGGIRRGGLREAFRLPPGDTSNGAWWRDRCGSTNDRPRVFRRSERQGNRQRRAPR